MNRHHSRASRVLHFSIAYAAMNVLQNDRDGDQHFSIAYAAMNVYPGCRAVSGIFSIAYAAMNSNCDAPLRP